MIKIKNNTFCISLLNVLLLNAELSLLFSTPLFPVAEKISKLNEGFHYESKKPHPNPTKYLVNK